jgi:hypothetical protein
MKTLLTILFFSISVFSNAQITITTADLPSAGSSFITATDTLYSGIISPGGTAQVWNYSQLVNHSQDTFAFQSAAGTPYASNFPGSTLAANSPLDSVWAYFQSSANGMYLNGVYTYSVVGVGGASNLALVYNPAQIYIPTPFTYGSTRNEVSRFQIDVTSTPPNIRVIRRTESTLTGDGYGSLTTPYATYPNTIRIKSVDLSYDSVYVDIFGLGFYTLAQTSQSQVSSYRWYKNGNPSLVLSLNADSLATNVFGADFLYASGSTGINALANQEVIKAYPNPTSDILVIDIPKELKSESTLQFYNNAGQLVNTVTINDLDRYILDVKQYPAGLYSYRLTGSKTYSSKFVIQH